MEMLQKILPGHAVQTVAAMVQESGPRLELNSASAFMHPQAEVDILEPGRVESFVESADR